MKTFVSGVIGLISALGGAQVAAQAPNINEMAKWTAVEVVHYDVVMEFAGEAPLLAADEYRKARVTDRVEVSFDWNQSEMKLVGMPVIKNFPSTKGDLPAAPEGCPPPRVTGTYEHLTVTAVTGIEYNPALPFTATRTFAAGAIPSFGEEVRCETWTDSPAATEPVEGFGLLVLPAMYLGMPAGGGGAIEIDAARSTLKNVQEGWTNTYRLSIK